MKFEFLSDIYIVLLPMLWNVIECYKVHTKIVSDKLNIRQKIMCTYIFSDHIYYKVTLKV